MQALYCFHSFINDDLDLESEVWESIGGDGTFETRQWIWKNQVVHRNRSRLVAGGVVRVGLADCKREIIAKFWLCKMERHYDYRSKFSSRET